MPPLKYVAFVFAEQGQVWHVGLAQAGYWSVG